MREDPEWVLPLRFYGSAMGEIYGPPFGGPPSLGWQKSIPWISLFFK